MTQCMNFYKMSPENQLGPWGSHNSTFWGVKKTVSHLSWICLRCLEKNILPNWWWKVVMYVVPSVKKSPTKQNPSHFRDLYNLGLYDIINLKLTGILGSLPPTARHNHHPISHLQRPDPWNEGLQSWPVGVIFFGPRHWKTFIRKFTPLERRNSFPSTLDILGSKRLRFPECFKQIAGMYNNLNDGGTRK